MILPAYNYSSIVSDLMSGKRNQDADLVRGFIAGAVGGLIGTALKTVAEHYFPVRPSGDDTPPEIIADEISEATTGEVLSESGKEVAGGAMHWLFGTLVGGAYGLAVEVMPQVGDGMGLPFGTAVFGVMHEGILPAAGVEEGHAEKDTKEESFELISHLVYGFATELVRGQVRERI